MASFGDGPGRYKQLLLETGLLQSYDAYDGAPFWLVLVAELAVDLRDLGWEPVETGKIKT